MHFASCSDDWAQSWSLNDLIFLVYPQFTRALYLAWTPIPGFTTCGVAKITVQVAG